MRRVTTVQRVSTLYVLPPKFFFSGISSAIASTLRMRMAHFFSFRSSTGADHGYGSICMSCASATRGPTPLGQM